MEALDFYEGLESDNTKTYWTAHKKIYDECVRAPLVALCEALEPEFGESHLFRPYNDLRFAKDRSPYKEQQGAVVGGHYLHVSAAGLFAASGYHQMASDQVDRYREAVDDKRTGGKLERVVGKIRSQGYTVGGDALKTQPRGYPADHPLDRGCFGTRGWPRGSNSGHHRGCIPPVPPTGWRKPGGTWRPSPAGSTPTSGRPRCRDADRSPDGLAGGARLDPSRRTGHCCLRRRVRCLARGHRGGIRPHGDADLPAQPGDVLRSVPGGVCRRDRRGWIGARSDPGDPSTRHPQHVLRDSPRSSTGSPWSAGGCRRPVRARRNRGHGDSPR